MKTRIFAVLLTFVALANCQAQNIFNAQDAQAGKISKTINVLKGYWLLYEASGTRYDRTANQNNLTSNNGVGQVAAGRYFAASFTRASSQYLNVPSNAILLTGGKSFEVTAWFHSTIISGTGDDPIVAKGNQAGTQAEFYSYVENISAKPTWQIKDDTGAFKTCQWGSAITSNTWYFIDFYFDAPNNQMGISINGGAFATTTTATGHPTANSTAAFSIGGNADGGAFWNGYINWVSYSGLLTTAQRAQLYNSSFGSAWSRF